MRNIGLLMILMLMVGVGCKSSQNSESSTSIPSDFFLSIVHEGGKGPFPVYKIFVDANGVVQYHGESEVENIGRFQKKINSSQMESLMTAIEEAKFWDFNARYDDANVMDLPSCTTQATFNGQSHTVVH